MIGALIITLPLTLYGIHTGRFWQWGIAGVLLGGAFNWCVS